MELFFFGASSFFFGDFFSVFRGFGAFFCVFFAVFVRFLERKKNSTFRRAEKLAFPRFFE
jgi:hypothetical protein